MREFSDATFERLKSYAEPLVDTIDTVINRALDALDEIQGRQPDSGMKAFNPAAPPNLAHTTVRSIELCGRILHPNETFWNTLLIAVLREAVSRGVSSLTLEAVLTANCIAGRKEDDGYRFYKDLDLSIQGQDSNAAWRATYNLAKDLDLSLKVTFSWRDNPKAAFPGLIGTFTVGP